MPADQELLCSGMKKKSLYRRLFFVSKENACGSGFILLLKGTGRTYIIHSCLLTVRQEEPELSGRGGMI